VAAVHRLLPSIATTTGTLAISLPCSSIAQTTNPQDMGEAYWGFAVCVIDDLGNEVARVPVGKEVS
jgi:hypothetical protein